MSLEQAGALGHALDEVEVFGRPRDEHLGALKIQHRLVRGVAPVEVHEGPGESVTLRNRETRLLEVFARHPGQTFSKGQLLDRLFSFDAEVTENAIEVYVGRLRRRIGPLGLRIETVRGLGYRLETAPA